MSTPTVNTRHTVTGKLQRLSFDQIRPFSKVLEIVEDDAKPYEPGMFKPGEVGEFKDSKTTPSAKSKVKPHAPTGPATNQDKVAESSDSKDSKGDPQ